MANLSPAQPNTVVVGLTQEPDSLIQDFSSSYATWVVLNCTLAKPVRYDDRWEPWPELLRRLPVRQRRADGTTELIWLLRPDFHWHDGHPLTADDVVGTYRLLRAMPPDYPHAAVVAAIDDMEALGPWCVRISFRADASWAPFEEWGTILPAHLLPVGLFDTLAQARDHPLNRAPIGSGPYQVVSWTRDVEIVCEAASTYPLARPSIDRLIFRFFPTPDALCDAVIRGEVDVTELTGFDRDHVGEMEAKADAVRVIATPSATWEHIDCNLDDPWLADQRVRQALLCAIDRDAILRQVVGATGIVAHSWLPPRHLAYADDVATYEHKPAQARRLLQAAGFVPGEDGTFRDPQGRRLELELMTDDGTQTAFTVTRRRPEIARRIQHDLQRAGIAVRISFVPPAALAAAVGERHFRHLILFAWAVAPEANGYLLWHSTQRPSDSDGYGGNLGGWRHLGNDRLLTEIVRTDEVGRIDLLRQQQRLWAAELPALPLFWWPWMTTAKRGLDPIRPVGLFGTYVTWNAPQWRWQPVEDPKDKVTAASGSPSAERQGHGH